MAGRVFDDVSSARGSVAIDVSGGNQTLPAGVRGIYVGTTGNLKVDLPDGSSPTFTNVAAGVFPVQATKVYQTGTTASGMFALY